MQIVDAQALRDGGTVEVTAHVDGVSKRFVLDYSLPWDGRPRHISVWCANADIDTSGWWSAAGGEKRVVPIGSDEEAEICSSLMQCLADQYGRDAVDDALRNAYARKQAWDTFRARQQGRLVDPADFDDPHPLPFEGMWIFVFDFIEKACREGKLSGSGL